MANLPVEELAFLLRQAVALTPSNQLEEAQRAVAYYLRDLADMGQLTVVRGNELDSYDLKAWMVFEEGLPGSLETIYASLAAGREPSIHYLRDLLAAADDMFDRLLEYGTARYGASLVARSDLEAERKRFEALKAEIASDFGLGDLAVREAAVEARAAATAAARAAGSAARARQSRTFEELSRQEGRRAVVLQSLAVAFLLLASGAAAWFVSRLPSHDAALVDLLPRLSVVLPGVVLFAYFVSEASAHRRQAAWAHQISVQLDTIEAFASPLSPQARQELTVALGHAVYSGPSMLILSHGRRKQDELPSHDVKGTLEQVLELVRAIKSL